ncbi:MAG: Uma2 family endonuclease, partial [Planctomycetota bacterium]
MQAFLDTTDQSSAVFRHATWDFYWSLRNEVADRTQITFDGTCVEVMPSRTRLDLQMQKATVARLLETWALLTGAELSGMGSPTLASADLNRGCEPDEAYTLGQDAPHARHLTMWDGQTHRMPDLVIEIDVTRRSVSKDPVYAALGVVEVWRWRDGDLMVYHLTDGRYELRDDSDLLSDLSMHDLADHVRLGRRLSQPDVV